ncbi:MAG: Nit6803 family nitriliase [Rhizobiaceae bacterium]|nr:Nit6803 family nitriliase [Rhizobiaceae bacterium]
MAERIVRAAAAQISPVLDRPGGTVEKVVDTIRQAAEGGAGIVVFPETFVPYYPYFSFIEPPVSIGKAHLALYEQAVTVPGPETRAVSEVARRHKIVVALGINERDRGTLYNAQLLFDADGTLVLKRRKITPTYHERMIWGQGDASGLKVVETAVGRIGALACWEHFNPLARFALMAQHEIIHVAQFPGSMVGPIFADQMEVACRQHALESGCFVINATGWLTDEQKAAIDPSGTMRKALSGGCCTAIISPEGAHVVPPMKEGEGILFADMDLSLALKRKRMMDSIGHYARPELLSLTIDNREKPMVHAEIPFDLPDDRTMSDDEPDHVAGNADQRVAVLRAAAGRS